MMVKKTFKISGMHCTSCSMVIEGELEDTLGVRAKCSYAKQTVEVECDGDKVPDKKIVEVIESQGYKVI